MAEGQETTPFQANPFGISVHVTSANISSAKAVPWLSVGWKQEGRIRVVDVISDHTGPRHSETQLS